MSATPAGVPRTLVRLKARLIINRASVSTSGGVQLAVAITVAVVVGVAGFLVAVACGTSEVARLQRTALVVGASALTIGWTVLPLLTLGTDESLDPAQLVLFPLRRGPLMRGLLLSSFVGPAPATVLVIVLGVIVGYARVSLVVVPAMVLLVLLSAAAARAVGTALASGARSRRGRDAAIIIASVAAISIQAIRFIDFSFVDGDTVDRVDAILRWWPPGMLGQAVIDAGEGRTALALAELLPAAVLIPLLLRVWAASLDRALTNVADGQTRARRTGAARRRARSSSPLLNRLAFLPARPWGAVAAKELRYLAREPRRKVTLVNSVAIGVGLPLVAIVRSGGGLHGRTVLLSTLAAYIVLLNCLNQFGLDGAAIWVDVVAGDTIRSVLIGKNVAVSLEVLPVVAVVGTAIAALTGGWIYLPSALLLAVAGLAAGLSTANVISVRFPFRMPESRSPFSSSGGGQGCATSALAMLGLVALAVILAPLGIIAIMGGAAGPAWLLVASVPAVAYGGLLWLFGLSAASTYGRSHEPERIAAVDPARAS